VVSVAARGLRYASRQVTWRWNKLTSVVATEKCVRVGAFPLTGAER
jgi:hypothetical protein